MIQRTLRRLTALLAACFICVGLTGLASGVEVKDVSASLTVADNTGKTMTTGQKQAIMRYMNCYYWSQATLEAIDPSHCFYSPDGLEAYRSKVMFETVVALRTQAKSDLTQVAFHYGVNCKKLTRYGDDVASITAVVTTSQRFSCTPEIESQQLNQSYTYTLRLVAGTQDFWKLTKVYQDSGPYSLYSSCETVAEVNSRRTTTLAQITRNIDARNATAAAPITYRSADHPYDRTAAQTYARTWVGTRNRAYADYSSSGGNCQNFVSQCIFTGGIPMDIQGTGVGQQWKWYSSGNNEKEITKGYSRSWAGVISFDRYIRENETGGIVGTVSENFFAGRVGDVLHMGKSDFQHATIVSHVVTDNEGETVDYLICSNTAEYRDFPAGAYHYTLQKIINIEGWNDPLPETETP